jgi:hypothetical protein
VHQWYNPACFTQSAYGTIGNMGRNALIGPGFVNTDFGVMKSTKINERVSVQFRAELFNIFNHPNFNFPATGVFNAGSATTNYQGSSSATAGQITSLVGRGDGRRAANAVQPEAVVLIGERTGPAGPHSPGTARWIQPAFRVITARAGA